MEILRQGQEQVGKIADLIDKEISDEELFALLELFPEAQHYTARSLEGISKPSNNAEYKFKVNSVFTKVIKIFSNGGLPVTLFIDDVQWADQSSIDLIFEIIGNMNRIIAAPGFFCNFLCTEYRSQGCPAMINFFYVDTPIPISAASALSKTHLSSDISRDRTKDESD